MPKQAPGLASLQGRTVLIVGVGREGRALADRLLQAGICRAVLALDGNEGEAAAAWRKDYGDRVPLVVIDPASESIPDSLREADVALLSPGIPKTGALYQAVVAMGIPLSSGTALFVADHAHSMIGVTGSKGKSTTSTLIHHLLVGSGVDAALAGNMGIPVQGIDPREFQVVELSSYQCSRLETSPSVVVLTALFPEHLDWHGSEQVYYDDKLHLVAGNPDHVIANGDDVILKRELLKRYPGLAVTWVGEGEQWHLEADGSGGHWLHHGTTRIAHSSSLTLRGEHNLRNALMAIAAASVAGSLDIGSVPGLLETFQPLAHRLEPIQDPSGVVFVNDSLATNPQAAKAALEAFPSDQVIILIGGHDRGVDYSPLVSHIADFPPKGVIGLPGSGQKLVELCSQALGALNRLESTQLAVAASMEQAVVRARSWARPGDYVVLSPGAPSFGQYRDYEERAQDFVTWIEKTKETRQ
ncbi:MAG: UDP-N-acetylmuramoyl-L-alanine--D-glutamate ligase [Pontimonas sp.]|nr:UDP-N-acetylmuramoyl-L-alanine--D-glutamate ligase [Pontimonas sp.]